MLSILYFLEKTFFRKRLILCMIVVSMPSYNPSKSITQILFPLHPKHLENVTFQCDNWIMILIIMARILAEIQCYLHYIDLSHRNTTTFVWFILFFKNGKFLLFTITNYYFQWTQFLLAWSFFWKKYLGFKYIFSLMLRSYNNSKLFQLCANFWVILLT